MAHDIPVADRQEGKEEEEQLDGKQDRKMWKYEEEEKEGEEIRRKKIKNKQGKE